MNSFYERRRRAASPPTWTCYERIQYDSESDESDSCSEDDEPYIRPQQQQEGDDMDMDVDSDSKEAKERQQEEDVKGKGKQKAEADVVPPTRRKARRGYTLQPILTIQRSQGFVWNQDLFVPPYIKDRYVVSTSPPVGRSGFISTSASSTNSTLSTNDYDSGIEVVEIRIQEGELDHVFA